MALFEDPSDAAALAAIAASVSAIGSAAAATATWRNARLTRRLARQAQLPLLWAEIGNDQGRLILTIRNVGPGSARAVGFGVLEGHQACSGNVWPTTILGPHDSASVEMHFTSFDSERPGDQNRAWVDCLDADGFPHLWSIQGEEWVARRFSIWRMRFVPDPVNYATTIRHFYGDVAGLENVQEVHYTPAPDRPAPPGPLMST